MAITLVQFKSGSVSPGTSKVVALDNPTTTGNLIVTVVSCYYNGVNASTPWTVDDIDAVTLTSAFTEEAAGGGTQEWFYRENITGRSGYQLTWHAAGVSTYIVMTVMEFSSVAASSSLDKTAGNTDAIGGTSYTSPASGTISQADELLLGAHHAVATPASATPDSGWTSVDFVNGGGLHVHEVQYQVVSSISTYASSGIFASSAAVQTNSIITFKAAAGATAGGFLVQGALLDSGRGLVAN